MNFNQDQIDALTEVINIGIGRAAASLSELVQERIELAAPRVQIHRVEELPEILKPDEDGATTAILQEFQGTLTGRAALAFPHTSALKLAQVLGRLDEMPEDLDLDLSGILTEVGNIVLNAVLGSISNAAGASLCFSVPELSLGSNVAVLMTVGLSQTKLTQLHVVVADATFRVASRDISGSLVLVFELGGLKSVVETILASTACG